MIKDPIVEEVRRVREEHAEEYGFDINAILAAAKKREAKSQMKVVSPRPQKTVVQSTAGRAKSTQNIAEKKLKKVR